MKHSLIYQNTSTCVYNRKKKKKGKKRLCVVHPSHVERLNSEDNPAPNGVMLARMPSLINLLVPSAAAHSAFTHTHTRSIPKPPFSSVQTNPCALPRNE